MSEQESKPPPVSEREVNIGLVTIPFQSSYGNPVNKVFVEIIVLGPSPAGGLSVLETLHPR